jgi:hypothetical protein
VNADEVHLPPDQLAGGSRFSKTASGASLNTKTALLRHVGRVDQDMAFLATLSDFCELAQAQRLKPK